MRVLLTLSMLCVGLGCLASLMAEEPKAKTATRTVRLFVQDHQTSSLKWADVWLEDNKRMVVEEWQSVSQFKTLDPKKQTLVQMRGARGLLCVGVRDLEDGAFESGWILAKSGVTYTDHGDHGHWHFNKKPAVIDARLDAKQGNPAHVYCYDDRFYLANDKLNGYTRIDPKPDVDGAIPTPRFLIGGGNHITLAVVGDQVGYAAWIDGGGPNKGRVDVTPVTAAATTSPKYSFHLPTGGIHGAITNQGKVFFAPQDGICWVEADPTASRKPSEVVVHHIPLGKDGDKPRRTGAFVNHGHYVSFVTGKDGSAAFVLLNAKEADPKPISIPLVVKKGAQPITPIIATTRDGKAYALIFHDHPKDLDVQDTLDVIALDPNGDGNCADAKLVKSLAVGNSSVEGHFGHHDGDFDADRKYLFFSNPGDGTISVLSLATLEILATLKFNGKPTAVVAFGGTETGD